ncbi:hypothetical protein I545_4559 [Mycobacterium kansasii 662]|uniref:Uncharacterized protein n=1 Tax=Mycobacterium kansasii 662 TaxID=1299326 RepID=X7ZAB2_MYCKA|nr:hypothetical protein I547_1844 [Mycobacterium kansasii 824]EUA15698.1 hypothetical protein I545_4559 [Mycobacterium kansasii 662]
MFDQPGERVAQQLPGRAWLAWLASGLAIPATLRAETAMAPPAVAVVD